MVPQALDQVTVLDLTQYIAGPYCTKLLADYGAHVIKVERPGSGDPARHMGPFFRNEPHPDKSGLFLHLNANKHSVTLDLKGAAGRRAFLQLVEEADILVESFAPRVMPSLGLDYQVLQKVKSALVMTSISNFGQTGPYRDFNSSEIVTYALGGPMYATGIASREPVKPGGSVLQYHAGATAASATMIALWAAEQSGLGDHVDISLMRVQASNQDRRSTMLIAYQYTGLISTRSEAGGQRLGAGVRPCADGYVALGGDGPRFERAARMIGRPDLLEDHRFKDSMARAQPGRSEEFDEYLLPWLLERTKLQVFQEAQAHHVSAGPINTTADLLTDPNIRGRRFWTTVKHPATGAVIHTGRPFIMAETPWRISTPAPRLGEHNREVLMGRLGMGSQEVASLMASPARRRQADPLPYNAGDRQSRPLPRQLPLAGVRVLALTVVWAGPHATQLLADWGAEVIRVESVQVMQPNTRGRMVKVPKNMPPAGWGTAYPGMEPGERHWNRFALFQSHARNKLSMTVDLRNEEGRDIFHRLLMVSDVFVENNVPETLEKLHMTYEELVKIKPDLVMLRMPAYGLDGPYKNYRSFGSHLEGTAGHSSIRGYADMDPSVLDDSLMGDAAGGVNGALAVMLGPAAPPTDRQGPAHRAIPGGEFPAVPGRGGHGLHHEQPGPGPPRQPAPVLRSPGRLSLSRRGPVGSNLGG